MNGSLRYEFLRPRWWRYGRPADFWLVNRDFIQDFVKKNQLRPIPDEHLVLDDPVPIVEEAAGRAEASRAFRPRPFPGGLRIAHLHLGEQIFQLDRERWTSFSQTIVKGFHEKIDQAGTVNVDQLIELSGAIDSLR